MGAAFPDYVGCFGGWHSGIMAFQSVDAEETFQSGFELTV